MWHILVPTAAVPGALYYAFKVGGPYNPAAGQLFDSAKVLLDPYTRGIFLPRIFRASLRLPPVPTTAGRRWVFSRLKVSRRSPPTTVRCHIRTT